MTNSQDLGNLFGDTNNIKKSQTTIDNKEEKIVNNSGNISQGLVFSIPDKDQNKSNNQNITDNKTSQSIDIGITSEDNNDTSVEKIDNKKDLEEFNNTREIDIENNIVQPDIPPINQNEFVNVDDNIRNDKSNLEKEAIKTENKEESNLNIEKNDNITLDNINKIKTHKPHIKGLKKNTPINIKAFTIGCSIFLILISGIITGALYFFINNPDKVNGIIGIDVIKSLLKLFSTIFFGFLFFAGFTVIVLNGYRLITLKDTTKGKFIAGLVFGIFVLLGSLIGGVTILQHINKLTSENQNKSSDLILIKVPSKDGLRYLNNIPNVPLIAPMQLRYSLNPDIINKVIAEQIGTNPISNILLNCGNGSELKLGQDGLNFVGSCLYQHKGEYPLQLKILYTDKTTNAPKEKLLTSSIYFVSELFLKTSDGPYNLSDDKTEIIMGKAPVKVFFDASKIFSDLKLGSYKISWDLDANGKFDKFDDVSFSHTYIEPKLQTVYYNIPELGKFTYSLLFRIEQSDVPICEIKGEEIKDTTYMINTKCTRENGPIVGYSFTIYDSKKNREIDTINSESSDIKYTFPNKGKYYIKLNFITEDGKKGRAESNIIKVGDINFKINYNIQYRGANDDEWNNFDSKSKNIFDKKNQKIILKTLPLKLRLNVNSINPIIKGTEIFVTHMGKPILSDKKKENIFQLNIQDNKKQWIEIRVYNPEINAETKIKIPIIIEQTKIIGSLQAFPDTVGETPFKVKLNASATKVTDEDDKIVYFSWDFDDGEKNIDTSQGIVEHIYTYNDLKENGEYHPTVIVKTAKGLTKTISLDKPILVKKPRLKAMIIIDSHPGQIAQKGDTVQFSIKTDGNPEKIIRNFGDGSSIEMEGRAATEQSHIYNIPGEYKIKATVIYDNKTVSYPSIRLIVDK